MDRSLRHGWAAIGLATVLGLAACSPSRPPDIDADAARSLADQTEAHSARHIDRGDTGSAADEASASATAPVDDAGSADDEPEPVPQERYTVSVEQVPAQEVLFALARDADLELDIAGTFDTPITISAADETLPRLLERIAEQVPMRYRVGDDHLRVAPDTPYPETYEVPYVDITRQARSSVDTATQVGSTGFGGSGEDPGAAGAGSNSSRTRVSNKTDNRFWDSLERNLEALVDAAGSAEGESAAGGGRRYVMLNREAGYVTVRATQDQHERVQRYIERVVASARRQVLIEATVVEVRLNERHQSGVDWALLANEAKGLDLVQNLTGGALGGAFDVPDPANPGEPSATIGYQDPDTGEGGFQSTIKLLQRFGDVSVVSSPKISALNNQLAILKVVDNRVYFTVDVQETTNAEAINTTFETEVKTVPVGLVMTVTPYIGAGEEVLLNVRPSVSRILGFRKDPNPELAEAGVQNRIPEIQVREMESLLRVRSGNVAVIGGLMQDSIDDTEQSVPVLGQLPLIGELFSYRDDRVDKTELIIFLRPKIVRNASVDGDYDGYGQYLPEGEAPDAAVDETER